MTDETRPPEKDIEQLIQNLTDSFNREMGGFRQEFRDSVERIERVTARHSKMITAGSAAILGLNREAEKMEALEREVAAMKIRLNNLEAKGGRA
jgi:fumarate hydratase class II